jgi:hypothetical protein
MNEAWSTMPSLRARWGGCLLALAWLAMVPVCRAENVQVTVVAILANERDNKVDDKIKCIADEVKKREPSLTGFRMARLSCKSLVVGTKETFPLVEDEKATVTIQHGADKENMVGLVLKAPRLGEITYSIKCGKCFPILTRYQTKDNERLILGIMVKPCNKGKPAEKEKK